MTRTVLYRIDRASNMYRYYRLDVQPDLFGAWCVVREWGRVGRGGQMRSEPFVDAADAQAALQKQRNAKERRGYSAEKSTE